MSLKDFGSVEVELDLRAVRIEAEQLPGAGLLLSAQIVFDASGVEAVLDRAQVHRAERHMVDDTGTLRWNRAVEVHVQHRVRSAAVKPRAGKAEVGSMADREAEQADVEVECLLLVLGDDGEVVHADDHRGLRSGVAAWASFCVAQRALDRGIPILPSVTALQSRVPCLVGQRLIAC